MSHNPPAAKTRHRFVREGEVPITYTSRTLDHQTPSAAAGGIAALRAELVQERSTRADAEMALGDARTMIKSLQTKLGHMELELQEVRGRASRVASPAQDLRAEKTVLVVRVARVSKPKVKRLDREPQPVKLWIKK